MRDSVVFSRSFRVKFLAFLSVIVLTFLAVFPFSAQAVKPSDPDLIFGVDVSSYRGDIDFKKAKADGVRMVYIRSSAGSSYVDPYFEANFKKARAEDIPVGFYHYVTARSVSQAKYQAHFFVTTIAGKEFQCMPAMDFEALNGLSVTEINAIATAFIEELAALGGKGAIIYSDASNAASVFDQSLTKYPLWVADWDVSAPSNSVRWKEWVGWQYSSTGKIDGIPGDVDLDYFTKDIYVTSPEPVPTPSPRPPQTETIKYTVKKGDTLWALSFLYYTTVDQLAQINHIKNPDLIYVNQVLEIPIQDDIAYDEPTFLYQVQKGNTLWGLSGNFNTTVANLVRLNKIKNPDLIFTGQILRIPGYQK